MDAAAHEHAVAAGRPARHQRRLGRGRGAVVVRGRDDVEVDELGHQRLVFVDRLERPLADLGLVRRVGRVPLAAEQQLVDRGRAPVAIDAGAEERHEVGPVATGQVPQAGRQLQLGLGVGQVQRGRPQGSRDVGEQLVDAIEAEGRQHPLRGRPWCVGRMASSRQPAATSCVVGPAVEQVVELGRVGHASCGPSSRRRTGRC